MYARVSRRGVQLESHPATRPGSVLFVDVYSDGYAANQGIDTKSSTSQLAAPSETVDETLSALEHLRLLAPDGLGNVASTVIRWPRINGFTPGHESLESLWQEIGEQFARLRVNSSVGIAYAEVGSIPAIEWGPGHLAPLESSVGSTSANSYGAYSGSLLLACREVELRALLDNGRGIWTPRHYHYRLPSGRHSGSFIRLADAVRSVRDSEVLSWWLLEHATEGVGIVIDTSTIISVVLALRNSMERAGQRLGHVSELASYPATAMDFAHAVRDASRGSSPVLGLLSVNSSGSVRERMVDALKTLTVREIKWALHTFVDKTGTGPFHLDATLHEPYSSTSVWSGLAESMENIPEHCELCNDNSRNRTVQIDPRSFDGLVLPEPNLVTPYIDFADTSRKLWPLCDAKGALEFDARPDPSAASVRSHRVEMGVKLNFDKLLKTYGAFRVESTSEQQLDIIEVLSRVILKEFDFELMERQPNKTWRRRPTSDGEPRHDVIDFAQEAQFVVVSADELAKGEGGGRQLVEMIMGVIAPNATLVEMNLSDSTSADGLSEGAADALSSLTEQECNICILALGVVTGTSLHSMLTRIQEVRRKKPVSAASVGAIVLHLRPSSWRARETITNPFGGRFGAVFENVFPDGPSPLKKEERFLKSLDQFQEITSLDYYYKRLAFLERVTVPNDSRVPGGEGEAAEMPEGGYPVDVFWGLTPDIGTLRPGSWIGERLSATATLAAVGSSVHMRRFHHSASGQTPEWRQFEIPAVFRSYFDPMIICSVVRWLEREECWWGRDASGSRGLVEQLLNKFLDRSEEAMLVCELLLASAMGKVPGEAVELVMERAQNLVSSEYSRSVKDSEVSENRNRDAEMRDCGDIDGEGGGNEAIGCDTREGRVDVGDARRIDPGPLQLGIAIVKQQLAVKKKAGSAP